jgi:hypothetical protein
MKKQMLQGSGWKKPEEKIVMSISDALKLLTEARPHIAGSGAGDHPKLEMLANVVGFDLNKVN